MEKLKSMREEVKTELEHIPRGNFPQNELRQVYWILRMKSLGKKGKDLREEKEDVLKKSIEIVRKDNPDFKFQYDENYFGLD